MPETSAVDERIDLDAAYVVLTERLARRTDLSVGPVTWKGMDFGFDQPIAIEQLGYELVSERPSD